MPRHPENDDLFRMALDIDSLEESFDLIAPRGDEVAEDFYNRIFTVAPGLRGLFPDDLTHQRKVVLATLVLVRKSLRKLEGLIPTLRNLGARHVGYGARPEHYPVVGEALIGALAGVAGDAWKPEYGDAWVEAYGVIVDQMLIGAAEAAQPLAA
jgi:hemoglobin-like flavoprotein